MTPSIAEKARDLIQKGLVKIVDEPTFNEMNGIVVTVRDNKPHTHRVTVFRNGNWSCDCDWFVRSKSVELDLWELVLSKPECKHALAVKLLPKYDEWISMKVIERNGGLYLIAVENKEEIRIKSVEEKIPQKAFKKGRIIPTVTRRKIQISRVLKRVEEDG